MKPALIFGSLFLVVAQAGAQGLGKEPGLSCSFVVLIGLFRVLSSSTR